jgi:hypothetical protein
MKMNQSDTPAKVGSMEQLGIASKRCEPCRATAAVHCSDPENCGGPWDKRHDAQQKVYKVDATNGEVRCVQGGPWPTVDSEGDVCYDNTHLRTQREALEKLRAECDAWLLLNLRERDRLRARIKELQEDDKRARTGLQHALAGLGLSA